MDLDLIKKLIKVVEKSEITDFVVEEGELKISISKKQPETNFVSMPTAQPAIAPPATPQIPQANQAASANTDNNDNKTNSDKNDESLHEVKSPIVGTFYRAPSPDADPFVKVGDKVMQTSNNYDKKVFNGDMGFITQIVSEDKQFFISIEIENYECDETSYTC